MARTFACREVDIDCQWLITAETEERLLTKIQGHVAEIHRDLEHAFRQPSLQPLLRKHAVRHLILSRHVRFKLADGHDRCLGS